jgi:hypothetical protein
LTYSIDITAITESWFSESISDDYVTLVGYNIYRCDRVGRLGGGICAWIKSDIQQQQISQHQCDDYESIIYKRKLNRANLHKLSLYLEKQNWCEVYRADSVVNKMSLFYNKVITALDKFMPTKPCRLNTNDKPWMTSYIKNLIVKRQRAWKKGNVPLRNFCRNKVSKEIKLAMGNHYRYNLDNTRSCNPRKWWKGVQAINRQKPNKIPNKLRFGSHEATGVELTELINSVFLWIVDEYQPLEPVPTPPDLIVPDNFLLSTCQVS